MVEGNVIDLDPYLISKNRDANTNGVKTGKWSSGPMTLSDCILVLKNVGVVFIENNAFKNCAKVIRTQNKVNLLVKNNSYLYEPGNNPQNCRGIKFADYLNTGTTVHINSNPSNPDFLRETTQNN